MIGPARGCLLSGRQCGMVTFVGSGSNRFPKHLLVGGDIINSYPQISSCKLNIMQACLFSQLMLQSIGTSTLLPLFNVMLFVHTMNCKYVHCQNISKDARLGSLPS